MKRRTPKSGTTETHTFYVSRERFPLLAKLLGVNIVEEWECDAYAEWSTSYEYADADGHRGMWETGIDDTICSYFKNGKEVEEKNLPDIVAKDFEKQIDKFDKWPAGKEDDREYGED